MSLHKKNSTKKLKPPSLIPSKVFSQFAEHASALAGTSLAFILALAFVVSWMLSGPLFDYSPHWEAVIAEVPAAITFLLVFLIQNSQNREMRALQLKVNELIRATSGAHTMMMNLEKLADEELQALCDQYEILAQEARKRLKRGETDEDVADMRSPVEVVEEVAEAMAVETQKLELTVFGKKKAS